VKETLHVRAADVKLDFGFCQQHVLSLTRLLQAHSYEVLLLHITKYPFHFRIYRPILHL